MDLPMGLNKFPGDDRVASVAEIESWVDSIEAINRSTSTVFFCITPFDQTRTLMQILKARGYPDSEILVLHKQWKSDKVVSGGLCLLLALRGGCLQRQSPHLGWRHFT